MSIECNYSFDDLYKAAFGKSLSKKDKQKLQILPQKDINILVSKWVLKAGWEKEKRNENGKEFIAFWKN